MSENIDNTPDFDEIAEQQGWNQQTMLTICRDYISANVADGGESLAEFAQQVADQENG